MGRVWGWVRTLFLLRALSLLLGALSWARALSLHGVLPWPGAWRIFITWSVIITLSFYKALRWPRELSLDYYHGREYGMLDYIDYDPATECCCDVMVRVGSRENIRCYDLA